MKIIEIKEFIGKTFKSIEVSSEQDEIVFIDIQGNKYTMFHEQDCCECVTIDDICGDLNCLLNTPILKASEKSNETENPKGKYDESFTWTFYTIATIKGWVDFRWYGTSNGCYSESVSIRRERKSTQD